jgi:hypothetical protein
MSFLAPPTLVQRQTPYVRFSEDDFRLSREPGGGAALDVGRYAVSCLRYGWGG